MTDPAAPSGDLYDLVKLSLLGSELTYAISLMRELGRRKQLASDEDNDAALQMPLQAVEFQRIIERNPGLAKVFEGQNEDAELQFKAFDHVKERSDDHERSLAMARKHARESVRNFREEVGGFDAVDAVSDEGVKHVQIVHFNDQADKGYREQEWLVYAITVDPSVDRVNVIFRGSRTPADWAANKDFNGVELPNPVKALQQFADDASLPSEVCIHKGFWGYLNRNQGSELGVLEKVKSVLDEHPTYSLFVTGHSLGGALASLFAVSAACRDDFPKPVRCITHAQPLVGDGRLLESVQTLEKSGNLLLLRTRNVEDGVPAVPAFSTKPNFTYTHIGLELKLYEETRSKNVKISASEKKVKNFLLNSKALVKLFVIKSGQEKQKKAHSLREHLIRLVKYEKEAKAALGKNWEDAYAKGTVVL